MSRMAINAIDRAMESWRQARKTNPPCVVHTQMALAHYQDAASQINQRIIAMEEVLNAQKGND